MADGRIDHVSLGISEEDLEEVIGFYRDILGFEPEKLKEFRSGDRTSFFFRVGESSMINFRIKSNFSRPEEANFDHFCLVLDERIEDIKQKLRENGVEILKESNPLGSTGRNPAVYVRDPAGYKLEIKQARE